MHLVHEVTSPQAFDGLRLAGRPVRRPDLTLATEDHNTPTDYTLPLDRHESITDEVSRTQIETLRRNCAEFGVQLYPMGDAEQGIVHVIGPQLGITQPGMTIVCGDSPHLAPTARSARSRSASAPARSSTCSPPRPCRWTARRRWPSRSTASCPTA